MLLSNYRKKLINRNKSISDYVNNNKLDSKFVTIVTTAFNSERTIEQTIKSVINQTYKYIEYIVIDGGSTDNTLSILKRYSNKINFILSEEDHGPADGTNKGYAISNGGYLFNLCSDDWIPNDYIEQGIKTLLKSKCGYVYGNLYFVDEINQNYTLKKPSLDYLNTLPFCFPNFNSPSVIYKKSCFDEVLLLDCSYYVANDYDLFLRLSKNGYVGEYSNMLYVYHRADGISSSHFYKALIEELKVSYFNNGISLKSPMFIAFKFLKRSVKELLRKMLPNRFFDFIIKKYTYLKSK